MRPGEEYKPPSWYPAAQANATQVLNDRAERAYQRQLELHGSFEQNAALRREVEGTQEQRQQGAQTLETMRENAANSRAIESGNLARELHDTPQAQYHYVPIMRTDPNTGEKVHVRTDVYLGDKLVGNGNTGGGDAYSWLKGMDSKNKEHVGFLSEFAATLKPDEKKVFLGSMFQNNPQMVLSMRNESKAAKARATGPGGMTSTESAGLIPDALASSVTGDWGGQAPPTTGPGGATTPEAIADAQRGYSTPDPGNSIFGYPTGIGAHQSGPQAVVERGLGMAGEKVRSAYGMEPREVPYQPPSSLATQARDWLDKANTSLGEKLLRSPTNPAPVLSPESPQVGPARGDSVLPVPGLESRAGRSGIVNASFTGVGISPETERGLRPYTGPDSAITPARLGMKGRFDSTPLPDDEFQPIRRNPQEWSPNMPAVYPGNYRSLDERLGVSAKRRNLLSATVIPGIRSRVRNLSDQTPGRQYPIYPQYEAPTLKYGRSF